MWGLRMTRFAVIFLLGLPMLTLNALAGQFKHVVYYPAGQLPYAVAAGQLTTSGNVDLVLADYLSNQVVTLLGNGDDTFQKPIQFSAPAPTSLAIGDFNEDGINDLAVLESGGTGDGAIAIFLGDGKGGFNLSSSSRTGGSSISVAVADFNGDGYLDAAVSNNRGTVMTFFGNGHGKLGGRTGYKVTGGPFGIAAGDLNGDHHPDLVATQVHNGSVAVLINDGTGHFQKPVIYSAGDCCGPVDVKIADLRNNGKQDLIIANDNAGMVVLLNKGDGIFGKPTVYPPCAGKCSAGPEACTVADFNLDGKLDIACSASIDDSYFFYGKGDGTFGTAIAIADTIKNQGGFGIASGDFNNDGAPDLAIPIAEYAKVAILLNSK
jgi:hypothetical protein